MRRYRSVAVGTGVHVGVAAVVGTGAHVGIVAAGMGMRVGTGVAGFGVGMAQDVGPMSVLVAGIGGGCAACALVPRHGGGDLRA